MSTSRTQTFRTLPRLLEDRAASGQGRFVLLYTDPPAGLGFVSEGPDRRFDLGFDKLGELARCCAAGMAARGVGPGDRVLLLLPTGVEFLAVFFGCMRLGAIPVPLVPPWSIARIGSHLRRVARIAEACDPAACVTTPRIAAAVSAAANRADRDRILAGVLDGTELLTGRRQHRGAIPDDPDAIAFLQFTSGSTSEPKGVVITHRAILANAWGIGRALGLAPGSVACGWLPLFHDMGLIGHVIVPLRHEMDSVLLAPEVFVRRPTAWLKALSDHRATVTSAPNFAYELCARRVDDSDVSHLDLGALRFALCGGEPVLASTVRKFTARMQRAGLRPEAVLPVYGLAEACLGVSFGRAGREATFDRIDRSSFAREGRAVPCEGEGAMEVVGLGFPLEGHELRITDGEGRPLPDRVEGAISIRGPSVMAGYYRNPVATDRTIVDGWLDTGDRGYVAGGMLFVTGRDKEMIVKGGHNLYPHDIEAVAGAVGGVRAGRCAAFGLLDEDTGTETFVVLCESRMAGVAERRELELRIMGAVGEAIGVRPDVVRVLPAGALNKTSSGKMQRNDARERYLGGDLRPPQVRPWTLARLWWARARNGR